MLHTIGCFNDAENAYLNFPKLQYLVGAPDIKPDGLDEYELCKTRNLVCWRRQKLLESGRTTVLVWKLPVLIDSGKSTLAILTKSAIMIPIPAFSHIRIDSRQIRNHVVVVIFTGQTSDIKPIEHLQKDTTDELCPLDESISSLIINGFRKIAMTDENIEKHDAVVLILDTLNIHQYYYEVSNSIKMDVLDLEDVLRVVRHIHSRLLSANTLGLCRNNSCYIFSSQLETYGALTRYIEEFFNSNDHKLNECYNNASIPRHVITLVSELDEPLVWMKGHTSIPADHCITISKDLGGTWNMCTSNLGAINVQKNVKHSVMTDPMIGSPFVLKRVEKKDGSKYMKSADCRLDVYELSF